MNILPVYDAENTINMNYRFIFLDTSTMPLLYHKVLSTSFILHLFYRCSLLTAQMEISIKLFLEEGNGLDKLKILCFWHSTYSGKFCLNWHNTVILLSYVNILMDWNTRHKPLLNITCGCFFHQTPILFRPGMLLKCVMNKYLFETEIEKSVLEFVTDSLGVSAPPTI